MPSKNLTVAAIDRLARPDRRKEISDVEKGLFLNLYPSGAKTFVAVYRLRLPDGSRAARESITLGSYPEVGLAEARTKAREILAQAAAGKDPKTAKVEKAQAERAESFGAVALAYVKAMRAGKLTGGRSRPVTQDTAEDRASKLNRHVLPVIGSMPLKEVTPSVVGRLLTAIEAQGGPVDNVLKTIRLVFAFAASRAMWTGLPPTHGMRKRQPKEKTARVLSDAELKALWQVAGHAGYPFGDAFKMLMLTGQRRDEIATAEWSWVDWERKLLIIPGSQVKNRAGDHEVPLSASALHVLREAQQAYVDLGLSSGYIFTSGAGRQSFAWTGR